MGLLNFRKKKEVKNEKCCGCDSKEQTTCCGNDEKVKVDTCCSESVEGICCVKVLGAGCKSCHEQFGNVKKAVEKIGLNIEVEYITDMEKVMSYGVMSMPAIVVNDKVVSVGKVLRTTDVKKLLSEYKDYKENV